MSTQTRVIPFDTLQYAKRLQSANVSPEQAAIQAEALQETLGQAFQTVVAAVMRDAHMSASTDVATKADLALLQQEMVAQADKITIRVAGVFIAVLGTIEVFNRVWSAQ